MSEPILTPSGVEAIAVDAFAKVRGADKVFGWGGTIGVDLIIIPGSAKTDEWGTSLTMQLMIWEERADVGVIIRDIKEQEIYIVPPEADDALLPAYFEGIALGLRRVMAERPSDLETWMPWDVVPQGVFKDPKNVTAEDFAKHVGVVKDGGPLVLPPPDDLAGTEPIAVNESLERAIAEDAEDRVENYLVYADWLTEHGDPRGELINLSRPDASPIAARRAAQIVAQNERYFAGNLRAAWDDERGGMHVKFALGWIAEAWIGVEYDLFEKEPTFVTRALAGLFGHPSSKFLRGLTLGCFHFAGKNDYGELIDSLEPRLTLRSLFLGDTNAEQQEISWTQATRLAPLAKLYPRLQDLRVHAGKIDVVGALSPTLKSLRLESGGLPKENLVEIARAGLVNLEHLEVWTGSDGYGGDATMSEVAPLLAGDCIPKVTRLGLRNCLFADEMCDELVAAPIAARVVELDLSMGCLSELGTDVLAKAGPAKFPALQRLNIEQSYVPADAVERLRTAFPGVVIDAELQRLYGDDRYVMVSE